MDEMDLDEIFDNLRKTLLAKNHDYGNSFSHLYEEYGLISYIIRIDDKISRLKTLTSNDNLVKDESIKDTLTDIAGYTILALLELEK
ncbi:MAG: DUF1599 domain-containing protein [Halanaerobiales bacterium]|nr:DUF1599 domain-containing protein [Halanaerobiales bacterium]